MSEADELARFALEVQQDVFARADAAEDGAMRASAFTELMIQHLVEASEIDDGAVCDFEGRGMRCSGWYLSEDSDRLDLFLSLPRLDGAAGIVPKADVGAAFRRLSTFLSKAIDGLYKGDLTGWLWTGLIERISQDRRSRTCGEVRRRTRSRSC